SLNSAFEPIGKSSMRIPWENFEREALDRLRALIRLDTTNPPGNERIAADYLAHALAGEGIEAVLIEPAPLRTSLVALIAGHDRSKAGLMLSSHTDVVPVESSRWTRAPFGAEMADGCIWGRGAIDMKSKCAMDLMLLLAIKRSGMVGQRDLILAAVADE